MIIQLLAAVLALAGLFLLLRTLWLRSGLTLRQTWTTVGVALLIAVLVGLAATGRLNWLVAAAVALVPLVRRGLGLLRLVPVLNYLFPGWHRRFQRPGDRGSASPDPSGSAYATTETAHLKMSLHQTTGHIDGEVLTGPHRGRFLSELSHADLIGLHGAYEDPDTVRLLETYLDRAWPDWRRDAGVGSNGSGETPRGGSMGRRQALEVLGLDDTASDRDILEAHRRLIQKLHPDRGGSTYLAATLNEAKHVLLDG